MATLTLGTTRITYNDTCPCLRQRGSIVSQFAGKGVRARITLRMNNVTEVRLEHERDNVLRVAVIPTAVLNQLANEAQRRHPYGLRQPQWARVALEYVHRGILCTDRDSTPSDHPLTVAV
nr:hypothetical protein [uncultured Halomonas sp.]